jgi:glutamyl-tRNA reductase
MGVTVTWAYHRNRPDFVRTVQLDDLASALKEADIVLSAVDAAHPVVTAEMRAAVAERNVLFVDLGVPRNIDPFYDDWGHGVTVADLDDLKLWHRVKTGTLNTVRARAEEVIAAEYRMAKTGWTNG